MSSPETPTTESVAETEPVTQTPAPRPPAIDRFTISLNVATQVLAVLLIVLLVNYLGFRHFKRWDLSRNHRFELSSQTKNVLSHLDSQVRAVVFFPQAQALTGDLSSLLREYEYAGHGKFNVEPVDPYRNPIRARELAEKYKFGASDNIVILDYKGKTKFVRAEDMVVLETVFGQQSIKSFKGEEAVTSALMSLTEEKANKLYLVTGHGEPDLNDETISGFHNYLKRQNIESDSLSLNSVDAVPTDASGLMIFGPKNDFSEREIRLLGDFWDRKGRLFILLNPAGKTPRLNAWLASQGITPQGDRVLKTGTGLAQDDNGNMVLRSGVILSPAVVFTTSGREVTRDLAEAETQLTGSTESLLLDRSKSQTDKLRFIPVIESQKGYWGSTTYVQGESQQVFFDPKKDHMGPLTVGVAVERGALEDQRVKVDTARMVVVGNDGFLTDRGLQTAEVGSDFAVSALNWMFNREQVAGIPPKNKEPVKLNLTDDKLAALFLLVVVAIPLLTGLAGLLVWTQRHEANLATILCLFVVPVIILVTGAFIQTQRPGFSMLYVVLLALLVPLTWFAFRLTSWMQKAR